MIPPCGDPACQSSTGICGNPTFGTGELSDNGYWERPCPICEAAHRAFERGRIKGRMERASWEPNEGDSRPVAEAACNFIEEAPGRWYYEISFRPYDETDYDRNGPFKSFEEAKEDLINNYPNPGGWCRYPYSDAPRGWAKW